MARRICPCGICENVNLPSACAACVSGRLIDKYKSLKKLSRTRDFLRTRVDAQLKAKHEADEQHHWSVTHAENIAKLKERLQDSEDELQRGRVELTEKQQDLDACSDFLAVALAQLSKKKVEQLSQFQPDRVHTHLLGHTSIASELHQKRRSFIRQIGKVFPLKRMLSSNAGERKGDSNGIEYWTVCGARLPSGDDHHSIPTQEFAASLGYMVQLLNLVAHYLSAPLLHNVRFAGSASRIWQRSSYWDAHSSGSDQYPLFIPQHSCTLSEEHVFPDKGTSILGFSTIEDSGNERLNDGQAGSSRYRSNSLQSFETPTEVQTGIKLLKRSVSCVSSYGFNLLLSSVPSNMTTFQAFAELLTLLSSKEVRIRSSRSTPHQSNNLAESFLSSASTMDTSRQGRNAKVFKGSLQESVLEGWDMVEHPTLPPPPSHSEDVEHWTRAMFLDATK